jgi:ADP-ribosyl-[dinitrogen reductase] hydrolase
MIGGGWLQLQAGSYTDDTEMMLCILKSIVENRDVVPEDVSRRFVAWARSNPNDMGDLTRSAIEYLMNGVRWDEAGRLAWEPERSSAGNGGLMRCAPVGLFRFRDEPKLVEDSKNTCLITHFDSRCQDSCVVLNSAIANLVRGEPVSIERQRGVVSANVLDVVMNAMSKGFDVLGHTSGLTLDTLAAAFWALHTFDTFEEALVEVVNLGGDSDTAGAVSGALLGAKYGLTAIPNRWLSVLQGRHSLERLATELWQLSS